MANCPLGCCQTPIDLLTSGYRYCSTLRRAITAEARWTRAVLTDTSAKADCEELPSFHHSAISWQCQTNDGGKKTKTFISLQLACFVDICSPSAVTDASVKWEPFSVSRSQEWWNRCDKSNNPGNNAQGFLQESRCVWNAHTSRWRVSSFILPGWWRAYRTLERPWE